MVIYYLLCATLSVKDHFPADQTLRTVQEALAGCLATVPKPRELCATIWWQTSATAAWLQDSCLNLAVWLDLWFGSNSYRAVLPAL